MAVRLLFFTFRGSVQRSEICLSDGFKMLNFPVVSNFENHTEANSHVLFPMDSLVSLIKIVRF